MPTKLPLVLLSTFLLAACADDGVVVPAETATSCEVPFFAENHALGDRPAPSDLALAGCIEAGAIADIDAQLAGLQADCVASEYDPATNTYGRPIPACGEGSGIPCFRFENPSLDEAAAGCVQMALVERGDWYYPRAVLRCACE